MPSVSPNSDASTYVVSYPSTVGTLQITNAEHTLISRCSKADGQRVSSIKFIREQHGVGLFEAMRVVDTILTGVRCPVSEDDDRCVIVSFPQREVELQVTAAEFRLARDSDEFSISVVQIHRFFADQYRLDCDTSRTIVDTIRTWAE